MTEQIEDQTGKKTLSLSRPGRLEIRKTVDAGQIRQSFSHGRTKPVSVEVRRKRTYTQAADGGMTEVKRSGPLGIGEAPEAAAAAAQQAVAAPRTLTEEERAARARALSGARQADVEAAIVAEEEARQARELEAEARRQAEEEAKRREEEEAKRRQEEEERRRAEEEAARKAAEQAARLEAREGQGTPAARRQAQLRLVEGGAEGPRAESEEDKAARGRRPGRPDPARRLAPKRGEQRRRAGKLTVAQALDDDERARSLASLRRARERERRAQRGPEEAVKVVREVVVPETIPVQELANRMAERSVDVIKALMKIGVMATAAQAVDADTAELVVAEFGHRIKRVSEADVEIGIRGEDDSERTLAPRPPVVTVMGHVDHGKTSLLDALRSTDVVAGEAGGITQHIGAYQLRTETDQRITFIDTPGHEAFTAMRARGATVTDVVVLVVAADDGVMPQTVEAIDHAKAASVPIIVAINKIDHPDADTTRVRNELLRHELVVEELGGDVLAVEVSAKERANLDKLEEAILLQAEVLELKSNPDRAADGVVVEARLESGRGAVATLLVQRGTLAVGDIVVAGREWGRVRALLDDSGARVDAAPPSMPVEVLGLNGTPQAGDEFAVVDNEARAREIAAFRARRDRAAQASAAPRGSLEEIFSRIDAGEAKELPVIVKADTQGSVEAIQASGQKLGTDEVKVRVLHSGVGGINESDVTLAMASGAMVLGFNVRANRQARDLATRERIDIRYYSIIYQVVDDLRDMLSGMLAPMARETILGNAAIQEVFNISNVGKVAGCRVTDGVVKRGARVRLLRDNVVVHDGTLSTLRRFKDDVREVRDGFECGMSFDNYGDVKIGDVIECYEVEEVARRL